MDESIPVFLQQAIHQELDAHQIGEIAWIGSVALQFVFDCVKVVVDEVLTVYKMSINQDIIEKYIIDQMKERIP